MEINENNQAPPAVPLNEARKFISHEINPSKKETLIEAEKVKEATVEIYLDGDIPLVAVEHKSSTRSAKSSSRRR